MHGARRSLDHVAEGTHLDGLNHGASANLAFGVADNKTLYLTARTGLYRIHLKIPGISPPGSS